MSGITVNQSSSSLCKNTTLTDRYVEKYKQATTDAVESILNMGLAVKEVYYKSKNGELNKHDLEYFCKSVGLDPKSSQFRKYKCIGEKEPIFRQYLSKMPQSFSVLYEIATLDADTFDMMYVRGSTPKNITLEQVKKLSKKSQFVPARNKISKHNPNYLSIRTTKKVLEEMNRFEIYVYSELTKEQRDEVTVTLHRLQEMELIRFNIPEIQDYIQPDELELALAA